MSVSGYAENAGQFGKSVMNCSDFAQDIALYCYGELTGEAEERLEDHLAGCQVCREELDHQKLFMDAMNDRPEELDFGVLAECRQTLRAQVATTRPWSWNNWFRNVQIPVGAMALVALGWLGAHYTPERFGGVRAGLGTPPLFSSVRSVEPDASGRIQISVDDVTRRVVSGDPNDPHIQALLLTAVREESNPGIRVESIGILQSRAGTEEVRRALLDAVSHDPNSAVRLKALQGLKTYSASADVRQTLASVLLKDDDPNVRVQAIDLLTAHRDDALVGVLQQIVEKEDNAYVQSRCMKTLQAMRASVGTY